MPARRDLDPAEMVSFLAYVTLIDVAREPRDYRFRLVGTAVTAISNADYTGRWFSELPGKGRGSTVWDNCETVVATRRPFSRQPPYVGPERFIRDCQNLMLPLSTDGVEVDMLLKVIDYRIVRLAGAASTPGNAAPFPAGPLPDGCNSGPRR